MRDRTLWIWQTAAGVFVLLLLGLHMTVTHLPKLVGAFNPAGPNPVEWANVLSRSTSPAFVFVYLGLLAAGLVHGLLGLRGILLEFGPPPGTRGTINAVLALLGLGLFLVGTWAAWTAFHLTA